MLTDPRLHECGRAEFGRRQLELGNRCVTAVRLPPPNAIGVQRERIDGAWLDGSEVALEGIATRLKTGVVRRGRQGEHPLEP